jgi:molybdopterin-binding protein
MPNADHLLTPREAARVLGISYPTIKYWILTGRLKTCRTPGGHHRIPESMLVPFLDSDSKKPHEESRERFRRVSRRNQILGKVVSIRIDGLLAEVILATAATQIASIITADAVRELHLVKDQTVVVLIKSIDVMIELVDGA